MRILGTLFLESRQILLNKLSNEIIINFSKDMMTHLMKIEYSIFKTNSELVLNSFNKSLTGIERLNRFVVGSVMSNIIEIFIISCMIFGMLGPKYFLNTIFIYGLYLYVTKRISKFRGKILNDKMKEELNAENKLFDIIYNIDNIKYFQRENFESNKFSNIIKGVRNKDVEVVYSLSLLNICQNIIISVGMVTNLIMGIIDCLNGTLTPGDIVMMQAIFLQIMIPLNFMGMLMREVEETKVNLHYAVDMIKKKEMDTLKHLEKENKLFYFQGGQIKFENINFGFLTKHSAGEKNLNFGTEKKKKILTFGLEKNSTENYTNGNNIVNNNIDYANEKFDEIKDKKQNLNYKQILKNCNVVFEKNTVNGIIGHSGNGKSTIFNLLYKLYEPNTGKILVDNQDISHLSNESYRKYLSICPQNGHLFNDSILNNILYGNPEATMDDVIQITKDVNLYEKIIKLPEEFHTNVGSLGGKLSGGEKQRILLARSFIKNSKILLLDEPTSNLDNNNEQIVFDYINKIRKDKTIIIIAHKMSTIRNCDVIHVLEKGRIVESGSHDQLIKNSDGIYYDLYNKMFLYQNNV